MQDKICDYPRQLLAMAFCLFQVTNKIKKMVTLLIEERDVAHW